MCARGKSLWIMGSLRTINGDVYGVGRSLPTRHGDHYRLDMARHIDRKGSRLNRFLEAKQKEAKDEQDSDGSKRPPLHQLHSATEVKKWIPSIRREVNYLLRQISSTRDPERKIEEFKQRLDELKKEHQKFVTKVQRLDPSYKDTIPWQPRGYSRKRSHDSHMTYYDPHTSKAGSAASKKLCSPLLEKEHPERSHDSHMIYDTSPTANKLEEQGLDEETEHFCPPKTTKSSPNLLGLDYSSSEDES